MTRAACPRHWLAPGKAVPRSLHDQLDPPDLCLLLSIPPTVYSEASCGRPGENQLLLFNTGIKLKQAVDTFVYTRQFRSVNSMLAWSTDASLLFQLMCAGFAYIGWFKWQDSRRFLIAAFVVPFLFTLVRFSVPFFAETRRKKIVLLSM